MAFFEDDASVFTTDFGSPGTLAGRAVRVILEQPAGVSDYFGGATVGLPGAVLGMAVTQPRAHIPTADVVGEAVGLRLQVGAQAWTVVEHRPDGTGMSVLTLERAA